MGIDIYPIVKELEICKEEVDRELLLLSKKSLAEREAEFNNSFDTLERILKIIGRGLFNAANAVKKEKNELTFYFWPGYTTIGDKRVLIKGELEKFNEKGKRYFTGIGFIGKGGKEFYDCPSTLYFDAALTELEHKNFVPPTTHNWKRQQPDDLKIKLEDKSNLKVLVIQKSDSSRIIKKEKQVLHVSFDGNKVGESVNDIEKFMSADSLALRIEPLEKKNSYIPWPLHDFNNKKGITLSATKNLAAVQKLIYPVWFAATFCDALYNYDSNSGNEWLGKVKQKLKTLDYAHLSERIEAYQNGESEILVNSSYNQIHFNYWYSLYFDNYETTNELGSAMFLTNYQLPEEFIYYAIPWLKFMYSQIRGLDYATQKQLETQKAEWKKNFTKLYHSQVRYFEALKVYVYNSKIARNDKEAILLYKDILEGFLEVAKEMDNLPKYIESKGKPVPVDITKEIKNSISVMKLLFQHKEVALRSFKIKESVFESYRKNLKNGRLFKGNFDSTDKVLIKSYPELVRLLIKDVILNAISYCDIDSPTVNILIVKRRKYIELKIENNRIPDSKAELDKMISPDLFVGKYGIQIIKAIKEALKWEMSFPTDYERLKKTGKFYFCFKIPK